MLLRGLLASTVRSQQALASAGEAVSPPHRLRSDLHRARQCDLLRSARYRSDEPDGSAQIGARDVTFEPSNNSWFTVDDSDSRFSPQRDVARRPAGWLSCYQE